MLYGEVWAAVVLAAALLATACGGRESAVPIEQVIPASTDGTAFGPLYPRVNAKLAGDKPDLPGAIGDAVVWAERHIPEFRPGSCAPVHVLEDSEFAYVFGRTTLGATLPWMQIFIRDGRRDPDPYLWRDASLFVSTLLHEFVHARQRADQAHHHLGAPTGADGCAAALDTLLGRVPTWQRGFDQIRAGPLAAAGYEPGEREILHRWVSPIERALDEIEASVRTVRWMREHPDELSELTLGGANNWAYGVQYLQQLKTLASSDCFSASDATYAEEVRAASADAQGFAKEILDAEPAMRAYLKSSGLAFAPFTLADLVATPRPSGRAGARCSAANMTSGAARLPLANGASIFVRPIPIDLP